MKKGITLSLFSDKETLTKLLKTMKLIVFLMFFGVFQLQATLYSQDGLFSLNMENTSMRSIFKEIEKQSDLRFFYNDLLTNVDKRVTVNAKDLKINQLLDKLLEGSDLTYKIMENNLVLISPKALLQQKKVTGKVVAESTGEALPGVNVIIKGTDIGTVTDYDGNYSIITTTDDAVLIFSFIGYETQEVVVANQNVINIALTESIEALDEIVVIGYGTQRKADVTSAIVSVKSDDFVAGNIQDAAELVKGKVAGLTVTKGSGDPNAESTIRLRGITSMMADITPLVLIDGMEGSLSMVAPENIASIDVLKDASAAAIYGTRGANGVILITTNTGKRMEQTNVNYSAYGTLSDFYKVADFMGPRDVRFGKTTFSDKGWDTDWLSAVSQMGYTQNHSLSITGGTQKTSYSANVAYRQEEGTIKKSNSDDLKMQFDLSHWFLDDKVKLNFNLIKGIHKNDITNASDAGVENIYRQAVIRNPTEPIYINGDKDLGYYEDWTVFQYYNPVAMIYEQLGEYKNEWTRMTGNVTVEPLKGWQTNLKLSTNRSDENTESYTTRDYYTYQTSGYEGYAYLSGIFRETNQLELTSRYDKIFRSVHRFSALVGYSYQYYRGKFKAEGNYDFPTDAYLHYNISAGSALRNKEDPDAYMASDADDNKLIGFFGRISYGYKDKYNILASVRHEGSSKFGANHKWGTFPAVSAGWTISNEDFLDNFTWITNLKLRIGYGVTGIIAGSSYESLVRFNYNSSSWGYFLNSQGIWAPSLEAVSNPNPDLKWEKSGEFNVGLDFGFLQDRLTGSIDYYNKVSSDLLYNYNVPSPPNLFTTTYANAGKMQNRGIEVMVKAIPVKTANLQYITAITVYHNTNKVVSLSNDLYETDNYQDNGWAGDPVSLPTQRLEVGSHFGRYYTLITKGLSENGLWMVQNPETGLYEEFTAAMTTAESSYRQWTGTSAIPKLYLNWDNSVRWKNFDLKVQLSSQLGFQIVNEQRMFYENNSISYNRLTSAADPIPVVDQNGNSTGASRLMSTAQSQTIVSWYYEDGDFVKIDYVTLGYTFNTSKLKLVNNFRVYLSGENLLCITKYKGLDPELSNDNIYYLGIDGRDKYPTIRSFSIGASINFK
ncbi:MAG: SusC/RagA family TonB-linked outer membrane protein [Bacteroidales bacterium]|nr:SusC/RagA family TonB-linked outer membrane protein [Bacteroidales bacterium]MBN2761655.1 SusC/RagA family TonB-linked outer membrane protein [Bacteroidales bacterium]